MKAGVILCTRLVDMQPEMLERTIIDTVVSFAAEAGVRVEDGGRVQGTNVEGFVPVSNVSILS